MGKSPKIFTNAHGQAGGGWKFQNFQPPLQSGWSLKMMVTVMMHHMFTKDNLDAPKYNRHLNLLGPANSTYKTIFV